MAKHQVRYQNSTYNVKTDTPGVTFPAAPTSGDLILLVFGSANDLPSAGPSGFTLMRTYDGAPDVGKFAVYAKVAGGSEPATYNATMPVARNCGCLGYVIEGAFSSLAALSVSTVQAHAAAGSATVLSSTSSIAQDGCAIAIAMNPSLLSYAAISSWSNSFVAATRGGGNHAHVDAASRYYNAANSSVQTVATFGQTTWGGVVLALITEAGGGGGGGSQARRRISTNASLLTPLTRNRLAGV